MKQGQADGKPGRRLNNPVYHTHEDTPKLTDGLIAEIAKEYMKRMGIVNTQYIVCRHTDREHQHPHIVANREDNDGNFSKGKVKYQIYDAIKAALPRAWNGNPVYRTKLFKLDGNSLLSCSNQN